jgi:hypothetical protein
MVHFSVLNCVSNADISFYPLRTEINYMARVYKNSVCTSKRTLCVSIRKAIDISYGYRTEHINVLVGKVQGFLALTLAVHEPSGSSFRKQARQIR